MQLKGIGENRTFKQRKGTLLTGFVELNVGVQYDLTEECRQNFEPGAEQGYRSFCQPVMVNHPHHILTSRDYVAEHLRPPTMLLVKRQSLLLQHVQAQTYLVEGYWLLPLEALRHGFEHVYGDQDNFVSVDGLRVDLEEAHNHYSGEFLILWVALKREWHLIFCV